MRLLRIGMVGLGSLLASAFIALAPSHAANPKSIESGKTQVAAKLDGREITVSELRSEMARLGISPNAAGAERMAVESIITRSLLARAARDANIHRKPEALRRMKAAQEQALADLYLGTASQPPEPTRVEIEDFILENPSLFDNRRLYTFNVLSMPTRVFEKEDLTPLFDRSPDFSALTGYLDKTRAKFSQTSTIQPSNAFPEAIRRQLGSYSVKDNIVIKGDVETQIMKITAIEDAPLPHDQAPPLARRALLEAGANERASRLVESLKSKANVSYYRASAAPAPGEQ